MACVCFGVLLWDDPNKPISGGPSQQSMPAQGDPNGPTTQGHHTSYAGAAKGGNAYTHDEKRQHDEKHAAISAAGGVEDVLFFPDGQMPCKWWGTAKGCTRGACQFAHARTSLSKFLEYLNRAQSTLDICVFTITCNEIAEAITEAHKRGVKVRILSDNAQTQTTGSDVDELQHSGIAVKHAVQQGNNLMHHKFAVIDNKLLLTGSFNWTRQAVLGNQENVLVTSQTTYVNKFHAQFEKLWATGGI